MQTIPSAVSANETAKPLNRRERRAVSSVARQHGANLEKFDDPEKSAVAINYWFALIDEVEAAEFLGLVDRTLQKKRQRGGGPRFVRLSSRCIRYRRTDLRAWADDHLRSSTSDPGSAEAA